MNERKKRYITGLIEEFGLEMHNLAKEDITYSDIQGICLAKSKKLFKLIEKVEE